jgi:hypothetical protein
MITKNTSVRLSPEEEIALNKIAAENDCCLRNGKPSWRIMLQHMAKGMFSLRDFRRTSDPRRADTDHQPKRAKLRKERLQPIPGAPDWWRPFYGNAMGDQFARDKSGLDTMGLAALGITPDHRPRLAHPDIWIGLPEWRGEFATKPKIPHYWWTPEEDNSMVASDAVEVSGYTLDELAAGGLVLDDEGVSLTCPKTWEGWVYGKKDIKEEPPAAPKPKEPAVPLSPEVLKQMAAERKAQYALEAERSEKLRLEMRAMIPE